MSGFWSFGNAQLHNQGGSVHMTETIVGPLSRTIVEALPTSVDAAVHAPPPLPSDDLFLQHLHRPRLAFADPYLHCHLRNKEEQSQEEACEYDNDSFCSGSSHGGGADDSGLVGAERAWLSSLVGRHDDPASTANFGSPSSSWLTPSSLATSHHPPHDNEGPLPTLAHSLLAEEDDEGRKLLRRLREERAMLEEQSSSRATTTATSSTQPPPAPTRSSCERSPLRSKVTSTPFQSRDVNALSHQQGNSGTKRSAVAAPPALSPGAASSVSTGSVTQRSAQSNSSRRSVSSSSIPHSVQQETKRRGEAIAASRKEVEAFSNTIAQQWHAIQEELEHRRAIEAITRLQSSREATAKVAAAKEAALQAAIAERLRSAASAVPSQSRRNLGDRFPNHRASGMRAASSHDIQIRSQLSPSQTSSSATPGTASTTTGGGVNPPSLRTEHRQLARATFQKECVQTHDRRAAKLEVYQIQRQGHLPYELHPTRSRNAKLERLRQMPTPADLRCASAMQKWDRAVQHHQKQRLRYYGFLPWRKLMLLRSIQETQCERHHERQLVGSAWAAWRLAVRNERCVRQSKSIARCVALIRFLTACWKRRVLLHWKSMVVLRQVHERTADRQRKRHLWQRWQQRRLAQQAKQQAEMESAQDRFQRLQAKRFLRVVFGVWKQKSWDSFVERERRQYRERLLQRVQLLGVHE